MMSGIQTALLIGGLACGVALTAAWDCLLGYEFFRFAEFVF